MLALTFAGLVTTAIQSGGQVGVKHFVSSSVLAIGQSKVSFLLGARDL
jgi:hypothetical protein